ncbi:unnamed protein product [Paramecium sonneborni]|uniref:Casein kinase I n=1 Tax=Paramecium sonneborni TaxID=65129 RepID=A0A8S1M0T1_9CILI|nr:unnamed protein product [Paramecium sonneborni]
MQLQISQYKLLQKIGCGSKHLIYKVESKVTFQIFALKLEKRPQSDQIENEIRILHYLQNIEGIPRLIQFGMSADKKYFLIYPLLHSNMQALAKQQKFSLSLILTIGLRIIEILEKVHKNNILHLDIKPENIMISEQIQNDQDFLKPGFIQLIDFGLSQKFIVNSKSLQDVFIGSLNFASRSSHRGTHLGYKDDLESLLYVLYYLKDLKLPWSEKAQWGLKDVDIEQIGKKKSIFFKTTLIKNQNTNNFSSFMFYIDGLRYDLMPDYDYIKQIFKEMIQNSDYQHKSLSLSIEDQTLEGDLEIAKFTQQINSDEIIVDTLSEKKVIRVSNLIRKYTTNQIKSIKDIEQQK